jgi:hypothetical protein
MIYKILIVHETFVFVIQKIFSVVEKIFSTVEKILIVLK